MSNRKQITNFLSNLLIAKRFTGQGKYYASEVTLDYGLKHPVRVDFMQFVPKNQISTSGLEKGIFICYEVKSCKADFHSGNGLNFEGEKNYIVTTMECYKQIVNEIPWDVGVMIARPYFRSINDEFENPTPIPKNYEETRIEEPWDLEVVKNAYEGNRKRSMTELLFCMLRAGR